MVNNHYPTKTITIPITAQILIPYQDVLSSQTMSIPPSHLLSLPRELRDKIYSDLHRVTTFDWKWKSSRSRSELIRVTIQKAPLLAVLLTCTQLHDEYLEVKFATRLSIILHLVVFSRLPKWDPARLKGGPRIEAVLSRTCHMTIVMQEEIDFNIVTALMGFVKTKTPLLASTRLLPRCFLCSASTREVLTPQRPYEVALSVQFPYALPDRLVGLPLFHVGEGYQIDYGHCIHAEHGGLRHAICEVGVYLYTLETQWDDWWGPSEILEVLAPRGYPEDALKVLPRGQVDEIVGLPLKIWGWMELRGEQVKTRKDLVHIEPADAAKVR